MVHQGDRLADIMGDQQGRAAILPPQALDQLLQARALAGDIGHEALPLLGSGKVDNLALGKLAAEPAR